MLASLEQKFGYQFQNPELLALALKHKSLQGTHNERLEFLGDSVLQLSISSLLYQKYFEKSEGELSQYRARLVNQNFLAAKARTLSIDECLVSEEKTPSSRMLCSAFEAVLGALFLEAGFDRVSRCVQTLFDADLASVASEELKIVVDFKTRLQEFLQQSSALPRYEVEAVEGPPHCPRFTISVYSSDAKLATGKGSSKREAEQKAASRALEKLTAVEHG